MAASTTLRALRAVFTRSNLEETENASTARTPKLAFRLREVFLRTWDLGLTAFGGPPVHFSILHQRFVDGVGGRTPWVDEQMYQELFAVCQALPGPASTKILFSIVLVHAGLIPAVFAFLLWSLPGAIGMFMLSLGISSMGEQLPPTVYALLSGLNASTVGIVALAAVQLAEKAIKDPLTRMLVIAGACAGLLYSALWYFPVLITVGGAVNAVWDLWLRGVVGRIRASWARRRRQGGEEAQSVDAAEERSVGTIGAIVRVADDRSGSAVIRRNAAQVNEALLGERRSGEGSAVIEHEQTDMNVHVVPVSTGVFIIFAFFGSFTAIMLCHSLIPSLPRPADLLANMYLAGTIIFGGGPVVIPLLREYVVEPGWVSPRDFLIGLAIIQAFPGPNFNFAVYLGALSFLGTPFPNALGALLGYLGIFLPGLILAIASQSIWRVLRGKPLVISIIRGVNATAVGLVFTAVYRLWQIGYVTSDSSSGRSLADEPFWVVVAIVTYAESSWFGVPAPLAIVLGGALGLCWYGVVGR